MSIDFSDKAAASAAKKGTTTSKYSAAGAGAGGGGGSSSSAGLYESRSLLCKNKCGYYGNSMQYDGYCSICYRRMKQARLQHQYSQQQQQQPASSSSSYSLSSSQHSSFDDSTSLLTSSQSFNKSLFSLDEKKWVKFVFGHFLAPFKKTCWHICVCVFFIRTKSESNMERTS